MSDSKPVRAPNPAFFDHSVIDNLIAVTMELGAELWVQRERMRVIEQLLAEQGVDSYDVTGSGFGAVFARRLAALDSRARLASLQAEPVWSATTLSAPRERLIPKPWTDPDGGALFSTWYRLRDLRYYDDVEQGIPRSRRESAVSEFNTQRLYAAHKGLWLAPESSDLITALQASCSK